MAGRLEQLAFVLAGTPDNTGPVLSVTVITWDESAEFPQALVAVHVRVMI